MHINLISEAPLAYAVYDPLIDELRDECALELFGSESPFTFKAGSKVRASKYRGFLDVTPVVSKLGGLINKFAAKNIPEILTRLGSDLNLTTGNLNSKSRAWTLRVRLLTDAKGFSLAPHKDSHDTVLAILVKIANFDTPTAVLKRLSTRIVGVENDPTRRERLMNSFCESIQNKRNGIWVDDEFADRKIFWGERGFVLRIFQHGNQVMVDDFYKRDLKIAEHEALVIHNPVFHPDNLFFLDSQSWRNEGCFHGVAPTNSGSRVTLIMDLLAPIMPEIAEAGNKTFLANNTADLQFLLDQTLVDRYLNASCPALSEREL